MSLPESTWRALAVLLDDSSALVRRAIKEKYRETGAEGRRRLDALRECDLAARRASAARLLHELEVEDHEQSLITLCRESGGQPDLEDASWLLARTAYPRLNPSPWRERLDEMAAELGDRLDGTDDPERVIRVIGDYLFGELGFRGNQETYHEPENSYLHCVLERRTGVQIALSTVYLLVAWRLRLPFAGIGMPGHFLVGYASGAGRVLIDPFHGGRILERRELIGLLRHAGLEFKSSYLEPVSSGSMLRRTIANLIDVHVRRGHMDEEARLSRLHERLARIRSRPRRAP